VTAPHYQDEHVTLIHSDCLRALREMPDESVHAVITDPPYGLANTDPGHVIEALTKWAAGDREFIPDGRGFMGKAWDAFVPPPAVWDECMRVLKPGGHLLAFAGSRTFDLMALSIRFAGFDIRDSIAWLYGSGFPKSLDVGKAIVQQRAAASRATGPLDDCECSEAYRFRGEHTPGCPADDGERLPLFEGWGTALKPAFEPVVVARKPFPTTVAANVLAHGTGALNISATRIATTDKPTGSGRGSKASIYAQVSSSAGNGGNATPEAGRWPANVVLDESQAVELDRQAPDTGAQRPVRGTENSAAVEGGGVYGRRERVQGPFHGDKGGASRFFYVAKAPSSERPEVEGTMHATVKPLDLMQRLVRLVTPPGGVVLEPFAGSGTTVEACLREGFACIAIEREAEYLPLIMQRLSKSHQQSLFGDWDGAA
jgi:DNA modification methylase